MKYGKAVWFQGGSRTHGKKLAPSGTPPVRHLRPWLRRGVVTTPASCREHICRTGGVRRYQTSMLGIHSLILSIVVGMPIGFCAAQMAPYSADDVTVPYEKAAATILRRTNLPNKGYCFVFGAREGRLAYELTKQSGFRVVGAVEDRKHLDRGRRLLEKADLYGARITLQPSSLAKLRYRDYIAALVVSDSILADGVCHGSAAEMFRMVRPDGGMAIIGQPPGCPHRLSRADLEAWLKSGGVSYKVEENAEDGLWAVITRGPLPGAGEWTHVRADVANTACSGDRQRFDRFGVLWFGEPGPAVMVDRHWRATPPLYKKGRLFIAGFDRIFCRDAYNGAPLWDLRVPRASRIAMMRDGGWLALADDFLYVARESTCLKVDVRNGAVISRFHPPTAGVDWGYVGVLGNALLGSEQVRGASYLAATTGRGNAGNLLGRGDNRAIITSRALFCLDRHTGKQVWRYVPDNAIIANVTICAGDGGIYFVETTAAKAVSSTSGRTSLADFTAGPSEHLVRLDLSTGAVSWRRQADLSAAHVLNLGYAKGVVLASSATTRDGRYWYHVRAFSAKEGTALWNRDIDTGYASSDWAHGKQDKQPLIIGDAVYYKQGNFDLKTGRSLGFTFHTSSCAESSASARHIFCRDRSVASIYGIDGKPRWRPLSSTIRPGCYTSIIAVGDIIVLPPASAGCTCPHSIQTTIAWEAR